MTISKIRIELSIGTDYYTEEDDTKVEVKLLLTDLYINENKISKSVCCDYFAFLVSSKHNKVYHEEEKSPKLSNESCFYPITCGCGIPMCSGIYDGIYSYHKKNIVKWKVKDKKTRKILGKKYFSFDIKQYEDEISKIWQWLHKNKDVLINDDFGDPYLIKKDLEFLKLNHHLVYEEEKL